MWEYNYSNELYHTGVKGMKWGVRKSSNSTDESTYKKQYDKAVDLAYKSKYEYWHGSDKKYKKYAKAANNYMNTPQFKKTVEKHSSQDYDQFTKKNGKRIC